MAYQEYSGVAVGPPQNTVAQPCREVSREHSSLNREAVGPGQLSIDIGEIHTR